MEIVGYVLPALLGLALTAPTPDTRAECERAFQFARQIRGKVYKQTVAPHWLDNERFWYRNDLPGGRREFIRVDAARGVRERAFDHEKLARALSLACGRQVEADRLPFDAIGFTEAGAVQFAAFDRGWTCDPRTWAIRPTAVEELTLPKPAATSRAVSDDAAQEQTQIAFRNERTGPIGIFWLNGPRRTHYVTLEPGKTHVQHTYVGHAWLAADPNGFMLGVYTAGPDLSAFVIDESLKPRPEPPGRREGQGEPISPDGRYRAFIRDHNLYLRETATKAEFALTSDGTEQDAYGPPLLWSPDSTRLAAMQTRKGQARTIWFVESAPKDQLQPRLRSHPYLKPGDEIDVAKPRLFDIPNRRPIPISDELFATPWSITELHWSPDSTRLSFLYNQRGHQVMRVLSVRADDGAVQAIVDEKSPTFIDYAGKQFLRYADDTDEIIWMSERDGWNHLYLYDARTGEVKNQITRGEWVVRSVERVDEDRRQIWFCAGGIRPGQDPYYRHLCRVGFDGGGLVVLTEGDGDHEVTFSPDRRYLIDRWSRVDKPPVTELRSADDGRLIGTLEEADWSELLATGWRPPERFCAKGRDGKTDIYGIIIRPSTFDPNASCPVIEEIYAGPQGAFVPKAFGLQGRQREIAELGFIVVQIDGMGTSHRSKAFHDVCWKNLGDSGFPDRIAWMKAAARRYPSMDLSRVGIYGGSAGGQSALRALLAFGDFYKAAAADCGCHDNRMDKIWWNELWMGWPVGPHYEEQSNVTHAHKLKGKLLLTAGELDENVDPASTMQVADALIRADRDFELLILPGCGHGAGETPYGKRRRMDFFIRSLREGG
jgi:dipeptidyl-peptidase-4